MPKKTYSTKASANRAAQRALHHLDKTKRGFTDHCSTIEIVEEDGRFRAIAHMLNTPKEISILEEALGDEHSDMVELVRDPTYLKEQKAAMTEAKNTPAPAAEGEEKPKTRRGRTAEVRIKEPTVGPKKVRKTSKLGAVMQKMTNGGATLDEVCEAFGKTAGDITHVNYILNWIATDRGYQVTQDGDKLKIEQEVQFV